MKGRTTPRQVADVLDPGAEVSAAPAVVTATALDALLWSATDPPLRSVEVVPDRDEAGPADLMRKVSLPVTVTRTGRPGILRPGTRRPVDAQRPRTVTPPVGASRLGGFDFIGHGDSGSGREERG